MTRFHLFLPLDLLDRVRSYSKATGVPVAECIRRALDVWLAGREG